MGNQNDKQIENDVKGVFDQLSQVPLRANPYLATRVMTELQARNRNRGLRFWKTLAVGSSAVSAALVVAFVMLSLRGPAFEAFVDRPFVVKMEVTDLRNHPIAKAEIQLPDGVYFDLDQFPELRNERSLTLRWRNQGTSEFIPFVLTSNVEGVKRVTVKFYDEQDNYVGEKSVDIKLRKGANNG